MNSLNLKKTVFIPQKAGLRLAVGGYAEAAAYLKAQLPSKGLELNPEPVEGACPEHISRRIEGPALSLSKSWIREAQTQNLELET